MARDSWSRTILPCDVERVAFEVRAESDVQARVAVRLQNVYIKHSPIFIAGAACREAILRESRHFQIALTKFALLHANNIASHRDPAREIVRRLLRSCGKLRGAFRLLHLWPDPSETFARSLSGTLDLCRIQQMSSNRAGSPGAVAGARWMHGRTALPGHSNAIRQSWPTPKEYGCAPSTAA